HLALYITVLVRPPRSSLFPSTTLFRSWLSRESDALRRQWFFQSALLDDSLSSKNFSAQTTISSISFASYNCSCSSLIPLLNKSRSEEHTSELQSRENLVCRLLLEKTKS